MFTGPGSLNGCIERKDVGLESDVVNNSNLLGRNREIEELEELISKSEQKIKESRSRLEDIPGIGRNKAAQLITKFGSTRAIFSMSEQELAAAPGIGPALAKRIKEHLKDSDENDSNTAETN